MRKRNRPRKKQRKATNRPSPEAQQWVAALSALGNEEWAEAAARFEQFMQGMDNPAKRLPIYHNLTACYLEQGLYDEALAVWDKIAEITPDDPDIWFGKATAYACHGQLAEAIETFAQFRRLAPAEAQRRGTKEMIVQLKQEQQKELPPGTFLYERLKVQLEKNLDLGDDELVKRKAERMIAINDQRPEGHSALGLALLRQQQSEEAIAPFLVAQAIEPDYVPTLYNLGLAYFRAGQLEEAVAWLEQAIQADKTYVSALHVMGLVWQQRDKLDKAVDLWQQALAIDPDYEPAHQSLFEVGAGPEPEEPVSPVTEQLRRYGLIAKARMLRPRIYRRDGLTLTLDPGVGFVFEDAGNVQNGTVYAGGPFMQVQMTATDVLHFVGVLKLFVRMVNQDNCRDMAILAYYPDDSIFGYELKMTDDGLQGYGNGRLLSDEVPTHLKVRVDSDLDSPYGSPFSGYFIYLNQGRRPGVAVMTLGLLAD